MHPKPNGAMTVGYRGRAPRSALEDPEQGPAGFPQIDVLDPDHNVIAT